MFVGQVVRADLDDEARNHPLVKHGAMYSLGPRLTQGQMAVAASLVGRPDAVRLRVVGRVPYETIGVRTATAEVDLADGRRHGEVEVTVQDDGYFATLIDLPSGTRVRGVTVMTGESKGTAIVRPYSDTAQLRALSET